jgi:hypothetical protein
MVCSSQGSHGDLVGKYRRQFELAGNMPDIIAVAPEINVAARERHMLRQGRFSG